MRPVLARLGIAIAVSGLFAGSAFALPGTVRTDHPRLYASSNDLVRLSKQVPLLNPLSRDTGSTKRVTFPATEGRIKLTFRPSSSGGPVNRDNIFGERFGKTEGLFLSYESADNIDAVLKLGIKRGGSSDPITVGKFSVPLDVATDIEVEWKAAGTQIIYKVGTAAPVTYTFTAPFDLTNQPFLFGGRRGDKLPKFELFDGSGNSVRSFASDAVSGINNEIDLEMASAWQALVSKARDYATKFAGCAATNDVKTCRLTTGGRFDIIEPAKLLALAYRLTGEDAFLTAAKDHLKLIYAVNSGVDVDNVKTNAGTGGEWAMSARVGAMGIYYDWLYDALSPEAKTTLRAAITQTVAFNNPNSTDDLQYVICGPKGLSSMGCVANWEDEVNGPSALKVEYMTGHAPTAQYNTALGLLAIQNEQPDVDGLIDTIYRHFFEGYVPSRAAVSYPDITPEMLKAKPWLANSSWGGHQTLFAYNSSSVGELAERLKAWEGAVEFQPGKEPSVPWLKHMLSPYIYGLRGDNKYPTSSDSVAFDIGISDIGQLALAAARHGDEIAHGFYRDRVIRNRAMLNHRQIWERLLFDVPPTLAAMKPDGLPLSAQYPVAGNVLIRSSWDHANTALLDFKSTSFISVNHHHYDQNSFSLFYKKPLLIDSGQYDGYATVHWRNYHERTIAHNSIVVFDPDEQFISSRTKDLWANDGGQWIGDRPTYPTVEDLTGANKLDGVTAYEEGGWYAYTEGNASKAYKSGKLNADAGFLRSIVYLRPEGRPKDTAAKATVVVFDKVRTATVPLAATSLLHMVEQPVAKSAPTGSGGRYTYSFASDDSTFTVRNGGADGGMATIQSLLPKAGKVMLIGGMNYDGTKCNQVALNAAKVETVIGTSTDCRYLVQGKVDGVFGWYNYGPATRDNESPENGTWRLEFSPATTPRAGAAQYFLNVIRVADSDNGNQNVNLVDEEKATLVETGYETVGVQIGSDRRIIFNGGTTPKIYLVWQPGSFAGTTLAVGLIPNHCYGLVNHLNMKALKPDVSCDYRSSDAGVVTIR